MCGIFAWFHATDDKDLRKRALALSKRQRHRGPDFTGVFQRYKSILVHERLAIMDPMSGSQPFITSDGSIALCVNGEIYNFRQLRKGLVEKGYKFKTESDCEVILYLYQEFGSKFISLLDGQFCFVLYDTLKNIKLIGRDHLGIAPLYYGMFDNELMISSEVKCIPSEFVVKQFPPGHYLENDALIEWYKPGWYKSDLTKFNKVDFDLVQKTFIQAVQKRLMSDSPWGVLLSGGLDSSLVASIATRFSTGVTTFSVGLEGSPDLEKAKKVSKYLGTKHYEFVFTVQDGLDVLEDVIYHTETYDRTTIRASTPMYIMARRIKSLGFKMVLSGEGADEALGGYLYFYKAPNGDEFYKETVRKLKQLHMYDCLRANKAMAAWGVESRVPFLDKHFLDVVMRINPEDKRPLADKRIEKYIIRRAFDDDYGQPTNEVYLPDDILWRQKEQFSDGVGYNWVDGVKAHAEEKITDEMFANREELFKENTPVTKEDYLYRSIFERLFPNGYATNTVPYQSSVACSTEEVMKWDTRFENNIDPSGRVIDVHDSSI